MSTSHEELREKFNEILGLYFYHMEPEPLNRVYELLGEVVTTEVTAALTSFADEIKSHWITDPDNNYDPEYQLGKMVLHDSGGRSYTIGEEIDHLLTNTIGGKDE